MNLRDDLNIEALEALTENLEPTIEDVLKCARQCLGLVRLSQDFVTYEEWGFSNELERDEWIDDQIGLLAQFPGGYQEEDDV